MRSSVSSPSFSSRSSRVQLFLDSFRKVFLEVDARPLLLQLKERFKLVLLGVFAKLLSDPFRELFFAVFAGALDFGVDLRFEPVLEVFLKPLLDFGAICVGLGLFFAFISVVTLLYSLSTLISNLYLRDTA